MSDERLSLLRDCHDFIADQQHWAKVSGADVSYQQQLITRLVAEIAALSRPEGVRVPTLTIAGVSYTEAEEIVSEKWGDCYWNKDGFCYPKSDVVVRHQSAAPQPDAATTAQQTGDAEGKGEK